MGKDKLLNILIFLFLLINSTLEKDKIIYKCGKNDFKIKPQPLKSSIFLDHNNTVYKRRLDSNGFKDFNIYFDYTNIKEEIKKYNLTQYENLFISSINKVINTFTDLLKVKPLKYAYYMSNKSIIKMNITYWDTSKFGDEAAEKGITTDSLDIDLIIFGRFASRKDLGENTLASAVSYYMEEWSGQPIVGLVNINKDLNYSIEHSQEYFESIILHEITHILGFDIYYFMYYFDNILIKKDKYGINRYYINSKNVINVAKKYFNCNDVIGVELENYGDAGTAGSHWEARILLGDYMNGVIYTEEQVISEFTLALLEDTGYYKANYYTGGLMRFGKNKGCEFLTEKCVNNNEINSNFENEYFDWFSSLNDPSCSSGRQSRTYYLLWQYYKKIPYDYQYFYNQYIGGSPYADYCPIAQNGFEEEDYGYYIGHCSNKGSGEYGSKIKYYNKEDNITSYYKSMELESITGEKYSNISFCYLSSLIKNTNINNQLYLNTTRPVCYETFCSSKSLTIKINDDYIVCPREGGKINVNEYEGYLLCPDYNLMCSGSVLCNDMFDCVEKKSEIKEDGYNYDYEIKTSQNIEKMETQESDYINNYELSEDGECPQYCKLCKENKKCLECRKDFVFSGKMNEERVNCVSLSNINVGHYKVNDSFYYECIDNCDICSDSISCESCNSNSLNLFNKCIKIIDNCKEYNEDGSCKICNDNFAFIEDDRFNCINIEFLSEYYTIDEGLSFISCEGEGEKHIQNCRSCHYDEKLICDECTSDKHNLFDKCVNIIYNCKEYNEEGSCKICNDNFTFIEDDRFNCINIEQLSEYYTIDEGLSFIKCEGEEGEKHIQNCRKCHYDEKLICDETLDDKYNLDKEETENVIQNGGNHLDFFARKKLIFSLIFILLIY